MHTTNRRGARAYCVLALLVAFACMGPAPLYAKPPDDSPPPLGASHPARDVGLKALAEGKHAEAIKHLLVAFEAHPTSTLLLGDLLRASASMPAYQEIWRYRYASAHATVKGKFKPSKEMQAFFECKDAPLAEVLKTRARAARDLAKRIAAEKAPGHHLKSRVWLDLLTSVVRDSPQLRDAYLADAEAATQKAVPPTQSVLAAIKHAVAKVMRAEDPTLRMDLGRALIGLSSQARQKYFDTDLAKTPKVSANELRALGEGLVRSAQEALAEAQMQPLSVKALEAMSKEQIEAFNDKHTHMATPGRALTPNGLYEIVTPCGHGTLLACAKHVEIVHGSLAEWFGKDPFTERRGQIRIFPEFSDLEAEDTPYWWAQGVQTGSVTRIKFSLGNVNEMMRLLTHELTHRFDAVFYPGLPKWLVEGRAVWTAGAYQSLKSAKFKLNTIGYGAVDSFDRRYTEASGLTALISQTMADYRDNYTNGTVLWVFLTTWKGKDGDKPMFAPQVMPFLDATRTTSTTPVKQFLSFFCDSADGRPNSLKGFGEELEIFLEGFRAKPAPEWTQDYMSAYSSESGVDVMDGPTLSRSRRREEPFFGQTHIRAAARVLGVVGESRAAVALLNWAMRHDELRAMDLDLMVTFLQDAGDKRGVAAAHIERLRRASWPLDLEDGIDRTVFLRPYCKSYLEALAAAAAARDAAGQTAAGDVLRGEHMRIARPLGLPTLPSVPPGPDDEVLPEHRIPLSLADAGWVEDEIVGYSNWRDLWRQTTEGHLVLGYQKGQTGDMVVYAAEVFVRSKQPLRTGYALHARIHMITPFVRGAIVVAHRRRDRHFRLHFSGGQLPETGGDPQAHRTIKQVYARVTGLRPIEGITDENNYGRSIGLSKENNSFDLLIHVKGSRMEAWIDGRRAGCVADAEGLPLDGFAGFAVSAGAFRVERAVVRELTRVEPKSDRVPFDAQLHSPRIRMGRWVLGGRFIGASPSPYGTTVAWYPIGYYDGEAESMERVLRIVKRRFRRLKKMLDDKRHRSDTVVVLPEIWPKARNAKFREAIQLVMNKRPVRFLYHGEGTKRSPPTTHQYWGYEPSFFFVDPQGIVRAYAARRLPDPAMDKVGGKRNLFPWWLDMTRGW